MTTPETLRASLPGSPELQPDARGTVVVLCGDLAGTGLDLDELTTLLTMRFPALATRVVDGLCDHPDAAVEAIRETGATRAVLAVCRRRVPEGELRARARHDGIGVYDIALVRVSRERPASLAARTIASEVRRLLLVPAGEPARMGITPGGLSRRALFKLAPALTAHPVAVVEPSACTGFARCGLCADACPESAVVSTDGPARVDAQTCVACGSCVGACPTGAIHLAGATSRQVEAQLASWLDGTAPSRVVFACARSVTVLDGDPRVDDSLVVELPALAVVTPGWVLQTLLAGAESVQLVPCDGDCCSQWRPGGASARLLHGLRSESLGRLVVVPGVIGDVATLGGDVAGARLPVSLVEPAATVSALSVLDADVRLEHTASPLGLVTVDDGCTTCGACATACPTGALTFLEGENELALEYEPARCTGCGLCSRACPEGVLRVRRGIDTARLAGGTTRLATAPRERCRACGAPLASMAVLHRNRRVLAETHASLATEELELCAACARRQQRVARPVAISP